MSKKNFDYKVTVILKCSSMHNESIKLQDDKDSLLQMLKQHLDEVKRSKFVKSKGTILVKSGVRID